MDSPSQEVPRRVVGIGATIADQVKHDVVEKHVHAVQIVDHLLECEGCDIYLSLRRRMNASIAQLLPSLNVGGIGSASVCEPFHTVDGAN